MTWHVCVPAAPSGISLSRPASLEVLTRPPVQFSWTVASQGMTCLIPAPVMLYSLYVGTRGSPARFSRFTRARRSFANEGTNASALPLAGTSSTASFELSSYPSNGLNYWKIVASNGDVSSESAISQFQFYGCADASPSVRLSRYLSALRRVAWRRRNRR